MTATISLLLAVANVFCDMPFGILPPDVRPVMRCAEHLEKEVSWRLLDHCGREVGQGRWQTNEALTLPLLPVGYYRFESRELDGEKLRDSYLTVVRPLKRKLSKDSPIGLMTALSYVVHPEYCYCPWNRGDLLKTYVDLLDWLGVVNVREMTQWYGTVSPKPWVFNRQPETFNGRGRALDLIAGKGIKMVAFNDVGVPKWADPQPKLPRDLMYVYRFAEFMAKTYGEWNAAHEFFNETIQSTTEGAWEFAACQKAAYLGFKAARPDVPVVHGAFCLKPLDPYNCALMENGLMEYSDALNYHTYGPIGTYPVFFRQMRELLKVGNAADRAIWVTEFCTDQEGAAYVPSFRDGFGKGYNAHTPGQEMLVAEFYPKSQIGLMMQGCALSHWFILPSMNERNGRKDWGMVRRDGSAKPVFASFATFIRQVGFARLDGEICRGDGVRRYLFSHPDGSQTIVFWVESELDRGKNAILEPKEYPEIRLRIPLHGQYECVENLGAEVVAEDVVTATRFPKYLNGLHGISADKKPSRTGRLGVPEPCGNEDRHVVVQIIVEKDQGELMESRSTIVLDGDVLKLTVRIWNFDDKAKRGRVLVNGGRLQGIPKEIILPSWGSCEYKAKFFPEGVKTKLEVAGLFEGRMSSWTRIKMFSYSGLEKDSRLVDVPNAMIPDKWIKNTNAKQWRCALDGEERAVRFDAEWGASDSDRWMFPVLDLSDVRMAAKDAVMLEFEVKASQDKVENDCRDSLVMLVPDDGGKGYWIGYEAPSAVWSRRRVILPEGIIGKTLKMKIGCCPSGNEISFLLRNVKLRTRKSK